MHPEEVLLHVIRPVELLQAGIAVEWLLLLVDVLMAGEQISTICGVRAGGTTVTLPGGRSDSSGTVVSLLVGGTGLWNVQSAAGVVGATRWGTVLGFDLGLFERLLGVGRGLLAAGGPGLLVPGRLLLVLRLRLLSLRLPAVVGGGNGDVCWEE